jgi:hypothetical protein
MKMFTVSEIKSWPLVDGWHVSPTGERVFIGEGVSIGKGASIGEWVSIDKTPFQVLCHPYLVYPHSSTQIGVGCIIHNLAYWMRSEDPDELVSHPECQPWSNYRLAIELVARSLPDIGVVAPVMNSHQRGFAA